MSHSQPNGGWINGKAENLGEPKFKGKTWVVEEEG